MSTVVVALATMATVLAGPAEAGASGSGQQYADFGRCPLAGGGVIEGCRIGYRTYGTLNADRSNIVLFPSWYNGQTQDMAPLVGPGGLLDSTKYFVVTIDALGDGVSSSPSNGAKGQQGIRFPAFTIGDMVEVEHRLAVQVFGAAHIHAVVGISMGGMQAFAWAARYPRYMDVVIPIVGAPWLTSQDRFGWNIMRLAVQNDPAYRGGLYPSEPDLHLANEIDTLFAYTPRFRARTTAPGDYPAFLAATDRQHTIGANNRVWQMRAIEALDVLDGASPDALARRDLPGMLIITSLQDHTVNPAPAMDWAKRTGADLLILDSDCGHMAAACEAPKIAKAVQARLAR